MPLAVPLLLALAAAAVPRGGPPARSSAALAPAAIVGRLVLRDGAGAALAPREARRSLGGGALALHLRSGWTVATARLDDDGFFVVEGEAGEWVIESLSAGSRVEFVDPPLVLQVRGGEVACAGRVEVAFKDLAELGKGTGRAAASDRCAELSARAGAVAGGRAVRARIPEPQRLPVRRSAWELATALRAGFGWRVGNGESAPDESRLSVTAVAGVNRPVGDPGALSVSASLTQIDVSNAPGRRTLAAGVGYGVGQLLELGAGAEVRIGGAGGGSGAYGQLRLGTEAFGLSLRANLGNGSAYSFGFDLAPLWLVGALL